ncbi:MAG: DUF4160 domain-containing protein [Verrucomicrobia bacterium]|nr:DUF4160 domain-containing protein [Verrucomicrobiota bacterium]
MSPTVIRWKNYRFFFFSREEERMHIHVFCEDGEAKFWLNPSVELAKNYHLSDRQLSEIRTVIEERKDEISDAWHKHFSN